VILRLAALGALVLSLATVFSYLHVVGRGPFAAPAARHLRTMKERTARTASVTPLRFAHFGALPHGAPLASYAKLERQAVSFDGYVSGMIRSSDGDIHLEITTTPRLPGGPEVVYVTGEVTPAFQRGGAWSYEPLRQVFRPVTGGPPFDRAPARVRIEGWLLYDWQYDGRPTTDPLRELWNRIRPVHKRTEPARRAHSIWPRLTGWEIHPVTAIDVWDAESGRFRRLAS
jgi:hypothetical protein